MQQNTSSHGYVQGRYGPEFVVCQFTNRLYSQGCLRFGCSMFSYKFPVLLAQVLLFSITFRIFYFSLKRFRQSTLSCQLLGGLVLGKSILGRFEVFAHDYIFPSEGQLSLETMANIGFVIHLFIIGVNIDPDVLKNMGKDAMIVGIASFLAPVVFCLVIIFFLVPLTPSYDMSVYPLLFLALLLSSTSFSGTASHLSDLEILNSDIGRLASLASMINEACNVIFYLSTSSLMTIVQEKKLGVLWSSLWATSFILLLIFVVRPRMKKYSRTLVEGQSLKESHFLAIILPALLSGFLTSAIGIPAGFGTFFYGFVIPNGPPLGTHLINKLDSLCSGILLPAKFALGSASIDIFSFRGDATEMIFALIIIVGYVGKFVGVLLSGLFFDVPLWDSISLSLIMCCRGVIEISTYITFRDSGMIPNRAFAFLIFAMLIVTGIARPLILRLYDPWRRYVGKHKNSILQSGQSHLRLLACIYSEDNITPIIDLIRALNPRRQSPISVSVLNLIELKGRSTAILERNVYKGKLSSMLSRTDHVTYAFDYLVRKFEGSMPLQHFTSIAPYATMHSDICTIAIDVQAHIIIVPFHKQKQIDDSCQSNEPALQIVNQNVTKTAPSTVGILIDRSNVAGALKPIGSTISYMHVFMLFLGGGDDREALALASYMIGYPRLTLTLVWLRSILAKEANNTEDDHLDTEMIKHFRANTIGNDSVYYREEIAKDAVETTRLLHSFRGYCDLLLVGKHHTFDSPLIQGMTTDWNDCPELGAIGDMLSCADFPYSVLVVKHEVVEEDANIFRHDSFNSLQLYH